MNISLTEDILPISYVKANLSKLIKQTKKTKRPIVITQNGIAVGVLNTPEIIEKPTIGVELTKDQNQQLIELIKEGEEDILNGRVIPWSQIKSDLEEKYGKF